MNSIHNRARAVIIIDHHILVCKHHHIDQPALYTLPGGHIDLGETAAQAVIREVKEETGLYCFVDRFLGCLEQTYFKKNKLVQEYCLFFLATIPEISRPIGITQQEQFVTLEWIPWQKLSEIPIQPVILPQVLEKWLKEKPNDCLISITENK